MKQILTALAVLMLSSSAFAKLPPPSDEAKQKAEEAKLKAAWTDKVSAFKLCRAQDKVAAQYQKAKGIKPAAGGAACQDPGPFVATTAAAAPAAVAPAATAAAAAKPAAPAMPAKQATLVKK